MLIVVLIIIALGVTGLFWPVVFIAFKAIKWGLILAVVAVLAMAWSAASTGAVDLGTTVAAFVILFCLMLFVRNRWQGFAERGPKVTTPKVPTSDRIGWTVSLIVGAFGLFFVAAILTHL